jgi:Ni/Co efflux regulator RcnB
MKRVLIALIAGALCLAPVTASAHAGHDHGPKKSSKKVKKKPKQTSMQAQRAVIYAVTAGRPA